MCTLGNRLGVAAFAVLLMVGCQPANSRAGKEGEAKVKYEVTKPEGEWKQQLTPQQYHVTREHGTEMAFSGEYHKHKEKGAYECVCCGQMLFASEQKYDSGCGWPSFWKAAEQNHIRYVADTSAGMTRTELLCARCGAHLGHVFDDGPPPTGRRYCINSASLRFVPRPAPPPPKQDE